jgi:hypothetical protein
MKSNMESVIPYNPKKTIRQIDNIKNRYWILLLFQERLLNFSENMGISEISK